MRQARAREAAAWLMQGVNQQQQQQQQVRLLPHPSSTSTQKAAMDIGSKVAVHHDGDAAGSAAPLLEAPAVLPIHPAVVAAAEAGPQLGQSAQVLSSE